jgi:hypothetical protein
MDYRFRKRVFLDSKLKCLWRFFGNFVHFRKPFLKCLNFHFFFIDFSSKNVRFKTRSARGLNFPKSTFWHFFFEIFRISEFSIFGIFGKFSSEIRFSKFSVFRNVSLRRPENRKKTFPEFPGFPETSGFRDFLEKRISTNFTLILMMCTLLQSGFIKQRNFPKSSTFLNFGNSGKVFPEIPEFSPTFSKFQFSGNSGFSGNLFFGNSRNFYRFSRIVNNTVYITLAMYMSKHHKYHYVTRCIMYVAHE